MATYFPPELKSTATSTLVDFHLKDGTVIRALTETTDKDCESVVGVSSFGRRFAIPLANINYVLEV